MLNSVLNFPLLHYAPLKLEEMEVKKMMVLMQARQTVKSNTW